MKERLPPTSATSTSFMALHAPQNSAPPQRAPPQGTPVRVSSPHSHAATESALAIRDFSAGAWAGMQQVVNYDALDQLILELGDESTNL